MPALLPSSLCTEASIMSERIVYWADRLRPAWDSEASGVAAPLHRKVWEWAYILEALHQGGVLRPGARGLGFGVGQDPLAAILADLGCEVVATDLDHDTAAERGWVKTNQYAGALDRLNELHLCDDETFTNRVSFEIVDMNRVPNHLTDFDFTWSACAIEHLGSIARGQEFVLRQMRCLRPGGLAVHTTEYNVFSSGPTISSGPTVLFRRQDIEWLAEELRAEGHRIDLDFNSGSSLNDRFVDVPPWQGPHLKLQVGAFVSTSLALVIQHSASRPAAPPHRRLRRHLALHFPGSVRVLDAMPMFGRGHRRVT